MTTMATILINGLSWIWRSDTPGARLSVRCGSPKLSLQIQCQSTVDHDEWVECRLLGVEQKNEYPCVQSGLRVAFASLHDIFMLRICLRSGSIASWAMP